MKYLFTILIALSISSPALCQTQTINLSLTLNNQPLPNPEINNLKGFYRVGGIGPIHVKNLTNVTVQPQGNIVQLMIPESQLIDVSRISFTVPNMCGEYFVIAEPGFVWPPLNPVPVSTGTCASPANSFFVDQDKAGSVTVDGQSFTQGPSYVAAGNAGHAGQKDNAILGLLAANGVQNTSEICTGTCTNPNDRCLAYHIEQVYTSSESHAASLKIGELVTEAPYMHPNEKSPQREYVDYAGTPPRMMMALVGVDSSDPYYDVPFELKVYCTCLNPLATTSP